MRERYLLVVDLRVKRDILDFDLSVKREIKDFLAQLKEDPLARNIPGSTVEFSENAYDHILPCGCHMFWEIIRTGDLLSIVEDLRATTIRVIGARFSR